MDRRLVTSLVTLNREASLTGKRKIKVHLPLVVLFVSLFHFYVLGRTHTTPTVAARPPAILFPFLKKNNFLKEKAQNKDVVFHRVHSSVKIKTTNHDDDDGDKILFNCNLI